MFHCISNSSPDQRISSLHVFREGLLLLRRLVAGWTWETEDGGKNNGWDDMGRDNYLATLRSPAKSETFSGLQVKSH